MFNGVIYFNFTPNGYVVDECIKSTFGDYKNDITTKWPSIKTMRIEGSFNFTPKRGQFCKRPHRLLVWS